MIDAIMPAARAPRAPQAKSDAKSAAPDPLAAQKAAFDLQTEIAAEAEREREALESLLLAQLKDEDEVMKKWIAMID